MEGSGKPLTKGKLTSITIEAKFIQVSWKRSILGSMPTTCTRREERIHTIKLWITDISLESNTMPVM